MTSITQTGITNIKTPMPITFGAVNTYSNITNNCNTNHKFTSSNNKIVLEIPANEETVKVNGSLILNGTNIDERLQFIEDMLHIPRRNVIMEEKYDKLKQLWSEYNETLAALTNWETLKESK